MGGAILLAVVALGLVVGGPIAAFIALTRVRELERRVVNLETRARAVGPAAVEAPPVVVPAPVPGAPPVIVRPPDAALPRAVEPPAAPAAVTPSAARPAFDLETVVAGRWLNRVGLLAVAVGVSFFLKYAIDNEWIGPRGQVALGLLLGAGLVAWSMVFVKRGYGYFADGLAGLGAAVMYLSLWAGTSYYRFISADIGFVAMIAVTAAMLLIALGRNSEPVAALALIGGFATPWLVSTGRDAQVVLFLYLALHNAALIALARARAWRFLELPAFLVTQLYFWTWYDRFYTDAVLVRTTLFATLFFAQFSALPVIRARRTATLYAEQGALILINAAAFLIVLRVLLWPDHRWALTLATLGLSACHVVLARLVPGRAADAPARMLLAGLALTLATLVIPIRLNGHWVTLAWAIEAAVLSWSSFSIRLWQLRAGAYVIFAAVALRLLGSPLHATTFLFNARLGTALVVAACAGVAVWLAGRHREQVKAQESGVVAVLAIAANVLVLWALTVEIDLYFGITAGSRLDAPDLLLARGLTISLLWTLYATALVVSGVRFGAAALRWQGLALFGITTAKVFLFDLSYLSGFYRIASSIGLGVVLLVVSFLYQRALVARRAAPEGQP